MWSLSFLHGGVNPVHRCGRVCALAHEHNAFDHVVIVNHDAVGYDESLFRSAPGESSALG